MARGRTRAIGAGIGLLGMVAGGMVAAPSAAAMQITGFNYSTTASWLNVRADASISAAVVDGIPDDTKVTVDCQKQGSTVSDNGASTSWWAHLPEYDGYVSIAYLDTSNRPLMGAPTCDDASASGDVTLEDLQAMFPGKVGDSDRVQEGLPSLNQAMRDADITTPERKAAFLATIAHESTFLYDVREYGDTRPYGGRGYIQLTGDFNYEAAGDYLGIDLLGEPELARSLDWSAPIARWYWTVNRDINPMADRLDMGAVNAAIGYPEGPHDQVRCDSFADALDYLLGSVPDGISCVRPYSADSQDVPSDQRKGFGVGDALSSTE